MSVVEIAEAHAAQELLDRRGLNTVVAIPASHLADLYSRFLRLNKLGQATVEQWTELPADVAALKNAIFAQSDFGALHSGQWLPSDRRNKARDDVAAEFRALSAGQRQENT
jgi:hypothetical protein